MPARRPYPSVEYIRGDHVLDADIIRSIWDNLCQATHVLVDLTGLNANVALELGIAHTLGRNVLLVSQDGPAQGWFCTCQTACTSLTTRRTARLACIA